MCRLDISEHPPLDCLRIKGPRNSLLRSQRLTGPYQNAPTPIPRRQPLATAPFGISRFLIPAEYTKMRPHVYSTFVDKCRSGSGIVRRISPLFVAPGGGRTSPLVFAIRARDQRVPWETVIHSDGLRVSRVLVVSSCGQQGPRRAGCPFPLVQPQQRRQSCRIRESGPRSWLRTGA